MVRTEYEMERRLTPEKAIREFFKKYPQIDYWKETFEYMFENCQSFFSDYYIDSYLKTINKDWTYALHLDINGNYTYICVVERT